LRVSRQADITTLDPARSNDVTSGEVCALLYDGLVQFDDSLQVAPGLAERWETAANGKQYTFHLRRNAAFPNGRVATAADVKYSFERVMHPQMNSSRRWLFDNIQGALEYFYGDSSQIRGVQAVDSFTVQITLKSPAYLFLEFMAMPAAAVVCREEVEKWGEDFARHPAGTGPFRLVEWKANDLVTLAANPAYWGGAPKLTKVVFRIIPETMTATSEFEVGNLDVMKVPDAEFARWTGHEQWKDLVVSQDQLAVAYIGLNNEKELFRDKRVRQALNHAVDRSALLNNILSGRGRPARGAVPPLLLGATDTTNRGYTYDPARARELLAQAGYPDGFSMEIWQRQNPEAGKILEAAQAYLAEVKVKVTIVTRDWASLKEAANKGEPDAFYLDWYADYPDAENFLFPLFSSGNWGGEGNRARYMNPMVDSLLDSTRVMPDREKRLRNYRRVNELVYADAPWIFLWHPRLYAVTQSWVKNYKIPPIFNGSKLLEVVVE
jgi:peptide/nickel transport system substrate-binding protein/oligopeptide transport system substrate-binding protein